jgi:hypothetical protein
MVIFLFQVSSLKLIFELVFVLEKVSHRVTQRRFTFSRGKIWRYSCNIIFAFLLLIKLIKSCNYVYNFLYICVLFKI